MSRLSVLYLLLGVIARSRVFEGSTMSFGDSEAAQSAVVEVALAVTFGSVPFR